jgi:hypothetical protein
VVWAANQRFVCARSFTLFSQQSLPALKPNPTPQASFSPYFTHFKSRLPVLKNQRATHHG